MSLHVNLDFCSLIAINLSFHLSKLGQPAHSDDESEEEELKELPVVREALGMFHCLAKQR